MKQRSKPKTKAKVKSIAKPKSGTGQEDKARRKSSTKGKALPEVKRQILIVAGGTGGHISPGLALAEEALARKIEVIFLSIPRNRDYAGFKDVSFPLEWYPAPALKKNLSSLLGFVPDFLRSVVKARDLIGKTGPDAVIALGGYPSLPAICAAWLTGIPFYLCEQNAVHGRVTRLFKRSAVKTFLTFSTTENPERQLVTGNPIRMRLRKRSEPFQKKKRSLPKEPVILALGGSQGAAQLNEMLLRLWVEYPELTARMRWILQAGSNLATAFQQKVDAILPVALKKRITIFGFDADIFRFFEKADVCVSRAGAGNITEAALFHLPMVLVPYPYAADNHQRANAEVVREEGAAVMIDRTDSDPHDLALALQSILQKEAYREMAERAGALARPMASGRILDEIFR